MVIPNKFKKLFIPLLVIILMACTKFLFGFHWGWIDDIYFMNTLQGTFLSEPTSSLFVRYYVFLSDAFVYLYSNFPGINWYGLFNYSLLFLLLIFIFKILDGCIEHINIPVGIKLVYYLFFYIVFLLEPVYLLTYTTLSILVFGITFVFLAENSLRNLFWILPVILMGILIRSDVVVLAVPILFIYLYNKKIKCKYIMTALLVITLVLPFVFETINYNENNQELKRYNHIIINALDGGNAKNFKEMYEIDPARSVAFFSWFQADFDTLLNDEFINSLEIYSPFSFKTLSNARSKLNDEFYKSMNRYPEEYTPHRNWFRKSLVAVIILSLLSLYFYRKNKENKRKYSIIILVITFLVSIVLTSVLLKMEYRIFYPLYMLTLIILVVNNKQFIGKKIFYSFLLILVLASFFRLMEYTEMSSHLKKEKLLKNEFVDEVNTKFSNKIILFDLFTSSLYAPPAFKNLEFNHSGNTFLYYGEVFSNFLVNHKNYLTQLCGSDEIVVFFKCLYDQKDIAVFAFTDFRVNMYELYFKEIYGIHVKFKKLEYTDNALNSINYSFSWDKQKMDYYIFDHSFDDYQK